MESDDSGNEADVCILPPTDGTQSNCEHIDEDDLAPAEPADVYGELEVFDMYQHRWDRFERFYGKTAKLQIRPAGGYWETTYKAAKNTLQNRGSE
jgi:hypothetical protein